MIALAWHTARARVASLAGSFVALALGVVLLAAMALTLAATVGTHARPTWFARAGVAPAARVAIPGPPLLAIALACLVAAMLGSVATVAAALRDPGQDLAAVAAG